MSINKDALKRAVRNAIKSFDMEPSALATVADAEKIMIAALESVLCESDDLPPPRRSIKEILADVPRGKQL